MEEGKVSDTALGEGRQQQKEMLREDVCRCPIIIDPVNFLKTFALESILAKICASTQGRALSQAKHGLKAIQIKVIGQRKSGRAVPIQVT